MVFVLSCEEPRFRSLKTTMGALSSSWRNPSSCGIIGKSQVNIHYTHSKELCILKRFGVLVATHIHSDDQMCHFNVTQKVSMLSEYISKTSPILWCLNSQEPIIYAIPYRLFSVSFPALFAIANTCFLSKDAAPKRDCNSVGVYAHHRGSGSGNGLRAVSL